MEDTNLIVNADDFGISNSVNLAILQSIESGLVTSTSMMANMPGFQDAVSLAREKNALAGRIGVHLNLTEGRALTAPILECPFFCDGSGNFVYKRQPLFYLGRREKQAVYEEWETQLKRILDTGIKPTHLDSHHHVHTQWALAPLICRLGREYGIPRIRISRNIGPLPGIAKRVYKTIFNKWRLASHGSFHNTDYFGGIDDVNLLPPPDGFDGKLLEIMVHPLFNEAGELVDLDNQNLHLRLISLLEEQSALRLSPFDPS